MNVAHAPIELRRAGYTLAFDDAPTSAGRLYRRLRRQGTTPDGARLVIVNLLLTKRYASMERVAPATAGRN